MPWPSEGKGILMKTSDYSASSLEDQDKRHSFSVSGVEKTNNKNIKSFESLEERCTACISIN